MISIGARFSLELRPRVRASRPPDPPAPILEPSRRAPVASGQSPMRPRALSRPLTLLAAVAGLSTAACSSDPGAGAPASCGVPASFAWSSTGVLLGPKSDETHNLVSIKDPSIVRFNDKWHAFVSTVDAGGGYSMAYLTFADWDHTADATFHHFDQTPTLRGYHAAPQVFFFAPQQKWYLIYQSGPPQFSTNDDIENPAGWTAPMSFYAAEPATVRETKGATGGWLDFWVICDDRNCYLFFSDDNGHFYRSQTAIADFPAGFGEPVVVMRDDATPTRLYEAANVYKVKGENKYLALIEAFDADSGQHRYFRSWTTDALGGAWTPLQDSYAASFASAANVTFTDQPAWSQDISHGEMLRDGFDQTLTVDTCQLQYLYQGIDPASVGLPYNSLPWRLALLGQTR
jgi:endo-1,4-beta-xylanase